MKCSSGGVLGQVCGHGLYVFISLVRCFGLLGVSSDCSVYGVGLGVAVKMGGNKAGSMLLLVVGGV